VASWEKSILERRYLGIGFGGGGFGSSGSGAAGVGADSECVVLWHLKQAIEQLIVVRIVMSGCLRTHYGNAQVGHLYFLGCSRQTPHTVSAMIFFATSCVRCDQEIVPVSGGR
jgi:hypothetical protein